MGGGVARVQRPDLMFEFQVGFPRCSVAGVDEVGRGCLAGPVVAGAVCLPPMASELNLKKLPEEYAWLAEVTDSKQLTFESREELAPLISNWVLGWGIGSATVEEIDRVNIFHASHLAMCRAVEALEAKLGRRVEHVLVDGNFIPKALGRPATAIVKGDLRALSIACASILAKVHRDRGMMEMDREYPGYGFSSHKGYSTPEHQKALKALGVCAIHRRSFAPVVQQMQLTLV